MKTSPENVTLILGGSGFLGPALEAALGSHCTVSTHHRHPVERSVCFDVRETDLAALIATLPNRPVSAVICLGITAIDECARDPAGTALVNVQGIGRVIDVLQQHAIVPMFISSDGVFDGSHADWREQDEPCPIMEYGRHKLQVERHLLSSAGPWCVVRLPKLLDARGHPRCMLSGWLQALDQGRDILCATDQFFTPLDVRDAAQGIAALLQVRAQGIYHLGGPLRLSRRELLAEMVDEYGRDGASRSRIIDCHLRDIPVLEPRPLDTSLSSARFEAQIGLPIRSAASVAREAVRTHFAQRRL